MPGPPRPAPTLPEGEQRSRGEIQRYNHNGAIQNRANLIHSTIGQAWMFNSMAQTPLPGGSIELSLHFQTLMPDHPDWNLFMSFSVDAAHIHLNMSQVAALPANLHLNPHTGLPLICPQNSAAHNLPSAPPENQPAENQQGTPPENQPAESHPGAPPDNQPNTPPENQPAENQPRGTATVHSLLQAWSE